MISIISTRRFARWTQLFKAWLSDKFSSISVDLTPLEEDVADVKSDVADVKDAVENIDLSSVAKQKALQELYCPNNHANLIKWNNIWLVSTGVQYGGFIIYNNVDVTGTEFYVGAASNPQIGGVLYQATATTIDFNQQLSGTITEVKQIKLSAILDMIGTPASGQESTLFGAIGNVTVDTSNLATKAVEQWLGLEESYEAEAKGGERTNNTVIDECKVRFQDAFNGLLPTGFTMPNSVTVDNLTYTGTTNS